MKALLFAAAVLLPSAACADAASDMAKTVDGFFRAYSTFHPSDGIPDTKGRAKYEPFISPALDTLLADGDKAEDRFAKANKDSPPLIEGDLFTSNFEGATAYKLGLCAAQGAKGSCKVTLTYDPGKTNNPKDKPFSWSDTVFLVQTPSGWRVDDIGYGGTWDFGNKGRMSDTLKSAIRDSGG
ncbi:MAG TPA: hypothetical protein VFV07_04145 [Rhizomicrobium sp.]|nr:hypothetical protein [Rhizomicrobium sp.]